MLAEKEVLRYIALRSKMSNITDAVLAATLKEILADGIVLRQQFNEIPPHVEYCLTDNGKLVSSILQSICQWGYLSSQKHRALTTIMSKMRLS